MPEPQNNLETAPETPVEETPLPQLGSEEPEVPEGTPAPSTPEEKPAESQKPPEKTPEQLKEDAAYWQTKSQEAIARLKEFSEQFAEPEPDATHLTPESTDSEKSGDLFVDQKALSTEGGQDVNQMLADNPMLGFAAVADHLEQRITRLLEKREAKAEMQLANREAQAAIRRYAIDNGFKPEELTAAWNEVKSLGLRGDPRKIVSLVAKTMEMNRLTSDGNQTATEAAAKAARAVKMQQVTVQPEGGSVSPPAAKTLKDWNKQQADEIADDDPPVG